MQLKNKTLFRAILLSAFLCLFFYLPSNVSACTIGVASGDATADGKPMLWKNRDVTNADQEFHYVDDGRIPFTSITSSGETEEYYGGVNAVGFAVANSNSYNLIDELEGSDDGIIHYLALATCHTVDDFQSILDSCIVEGALLTANYGVIDAFGGAAMFECDNYSYARYNASEEGGFIVRSNYSYSGDLSNYANLVAWGLFRHDRAYSLWDAAVTANTLTPQYIFRNVIRDLAIEGTDPYPLPYDGQIAGYPYGCIPNTQAICRATTRSVQVIQGVPADADPGDAILWAMCGNPLATVPLPLWVRAGSVPLEMDSNSGSRICDRGIELADWIYDQVAVVNTWKLTNPRENGLWDDIFPLTDWVFSEATNFKNSEDYNDDNLLEDFQNELATYIADELDAWQQDISPILCEVPGDYATIQEAINASQEGDTVLVHPGTYTGPLEFRGNNIVVGSLFLTTGDDSYIESTVIDCDGNGRSVAVFTNGENSNTVLSGFTLQNAYTNYGGGVYCNGASPTLDHLLIRNCETTINGAGIYATHNANPVLSNVTIVGNVAAGIGGAIHTYDNSAPTVTNSIIWNNIPAAIPVSVNISYSDVEGAGGGTNIDSDPLFVDPANGDYHLSWSNFPTQDNTCSPCIDFGDPNSPVDLDGTTVDMGVFYFDQNQEAGPIWTDVPESINATEGDLIAFAVIGMDPNDDALTITLDPDGLPEGYVFNDNENGTASFSWQTAEGDAENYTATFTISDGVNSADAIVPISVTLPGPEEAFASSETTISGTVQGNYTNTTDSDNSYEILTEIETDGNPAKNRYSYLEHIWTFEITGFALVLHAEAYRNANLDVDDFVLEGSFDGQNYTDLLTVNSHIEAVYTAEIEGIATGNYYVKVTDTNRTAGKRSLDSFYLDMLSINYETGDVPNQDPVWTEVPAEVTGYPDTEIAFSVAGTDPEGADLTITYSGVGIPEGCLTNTGNGTAEFAWTPTVTNEYTATFRISDGELYVDRDVTIYVVEEPEPSTMYVSAINLTENVINRNFSTCTGVVTVLDLEEAAVEGALVSATWSGLFNADVQGTTDANGLVTFVTGNMRTPDDLLTLTITDVTKAEWIYDVDNENNIAVAELDFGDLAGSGGLALNPDAPVPDALTLSPTYPNPFNDRTTISFGLPDYGNARITVYDLMGKQVSILANSSYQAGWHSVAWNPRLLANGKYIVRLESAGSVKIGYIVLIK